MADLSVIPELDRFGPEEAWRLGSTLVGRCRAEQLPVTILVRLGSQRVFHVALPGTSADNDGWAERKARAVAHFDLASADVFSRYVADNPDFFRLFALSPDEYAPFPGAVPIRVRGTLVGVLAVSGLESGEDHQLALDALAAEAAAQAPAPRRYRTLRPGQRAQVWVGGPDLAEPQLVHETWQLLVEAPNWSADGASLYVNGDGTLWRLPLDRPGAGLEPVTHPGLPPINNDHVLDPDGRHIYLSAGDGHIYRGALTGGEVERVTADEGVWHFLHGVSPDGSRLAYVQLADFGEPGRLAVLTPPGPPVLLDAGAGHLDGPEWSPDGKWIYLNTESFSTQPGHAQLARLPDGGGTLERLLTSDTVDWFPHLAPDGRHAAYVSFPLGTLGHPADLDVEVKVVATDDWAHSLQTYPCFGGQGTLNVTSWAPDGRRFAFVSYPLGEDVS